MTLSTTVVLHDLAILGTASSISNDYFAMAVNTLHGYIVCYITILAFNLELTSAWSDVAL
jgi:hypothetical protein